MISTAIFTLLTGDFISVRIFMACMMTGQDKNHFIMLSKTILSFKLDSIKVIKELIKDVSTHPVI